MKFSVEAKVAAAIAACFGILSMCAIAQEQSQHGKLRSDRSGAINTAPHGDMSLNVSSGSLSTVYDG
jgi:hypothetical protein